MAISTVQLIATMSTKTAFGTGFYYAVPHSTNPMKCQIVVMTNKHVLEGADKLILICPVSDNGKISPGAFERFIIPQPFDHAHKHPSNDVDLCAIPITALLESAKQRGRPILYAPYSSGLLADEKCYDDLRQLDSVLMIGVKSRLQVNTSFLMVG